MVIVLILLLYVGVFFGVKWGWTNTAGVIDRTPLIKKTNPSWAETAEWQTLAAALEKDDVVIERVAEETGVEPQLIAAMVVPEQLRLFFSEREIFKQVFAPLKILGRQTQFSWGIAGLKQETAKQIEERDTTHLLDFQTDNHDEERFNRITDEHDHYYSYLYTALFLKEIIAEWQAAGFDISRRPEILATLYNIGFEHSVPKSRPQVGGSAIEINGSTYSFGGLAYDFYWSNLLGRFAARDAEDV